MADLRDGLDEARRGLWRSAAESFAAAAAACPTDPAPALAEASTQLRRGGPQHALVVLETRPALRAPGPPWEARRDWLITAARLSMGDPLGAERAAGRLPAPWRRRALAALRLAEGAYVEGVDLLLAGRR